MAAVSTVALIATAPGQTFVISQLNVSLRTAFGIEPLTLNSAYTLATVLAALPLVWIGRLVDRFGPRRSLASVAAAFAVACALMATAQGVVGMFLGFFGLRLLGQGALALVSQHTLAMWFHRRLGAIQGMKQVVLFLAWMPLPLLAATLIEKVGWRSTYVVFGGAVALAVIPLALFFVRDRPEDLGLHMDGDRPASQDATGPGAGPEASSGGGAERGVRGLREEPRTDSPDWTLAQALRSRAFWTLAGLHFVSPLIGTALLFDLQPILVARGLDATSAALPISVWSATMALASLPSGLLADRFRARGLILLATALIATGPLLLWRGGGLLAACIALSCGAVGQSLGTATGGASLARFFGRSQHGAIRASVSRIAVIGAGLGPLVTGLSASLAEDYDPALLGLALLTAPVLLAACWLEPPGRAGDAGERTGPP